MLVALVALGIIFFGMANAMDASSHPLLDTRSEVKISNFTGKDEDWGLWNLRFEGWTGLMGWEEVMEPAAASTELIGNAMLRPTASAKTT